MTGQEKGVFNTDSCLIQVTASAGLTIPLITDSLYFVL